MKYDKSRVYTALDADELKVGSRVIVANYLESLIAQVEANACPTYVSELSGIMGTSSTNRFKVGDKTYNLAYLISEPEEKKLKWTDLKIGDVVKCKIRAVTKLVTGIDESAPIDGLHILLCNEWVDDKELESWEKEEK